MDVLQNMMLFSELVQCGGNVYTWCYDAKGKLLRSNCPDEAFLASAFELFGCKQRMLEHGNRDDVPVTLGTALGLLWGAAFEKEEGKLKRVWVIGPVFHRDVTMRGIEDGLKYYSKLEISVAWTIQLYKALEKVPALQNTIIYRYLLMMHYCLTGQRLELSCVNSSTAQEERLESSAIPHDRYKVWMAEQGMLQMVRTGDMNYKQALSNCMSISAGVPVQSSDVLRQSKTSIIVFTSLVCRAAIEGGLSPEEAYSLGDSYIQTAEAAKSLDELHPLAMMMYDDFIRRVHKHRTNPNLSMQIQKCVDYIEMNLDNKLEQQLLAVFTDITCSELKPEATLEQINQLPGYFVNLATQLKNGTYDAWEKEFRIQDYQAYSDINVWADRLMTKHYSCLDNLTGIAVEANDEIIVLVGNTHGYPVALQCIGEETTSFGEEKNYVQTAASGDIYFLKEGVNKITIRNRGQLFVMYTADLQSNPTSIRIHIPLGSGQVTGYFDLQRHQTNEKYAELLSKATDKYFGVKGEKMIFYFHRSEMLKHVRTEILSAIHLWDNIVEWEQSLMGIDKMHANQFNNHLFAISPEGAYMWASDYRIAFVYTYLDNILLYDKVMLAEDNAWGPAHEIGHVHQLAIDWMGSTESSNNLFSNYIIYQLGKYKSRGRGLDYLAECVYGQNQAWYNMGSATHQGEDTEIHMRMNWQLWLYYELCKGHDKKPMVWPKIFELMRTTYQHVPTHQPGQRQMAFVKAVCDATQEDLTEFFETWGFFKAVDAPIEQYGQAQYTVTEQMICETKAYIQNKKYPKAAPIQYIEDRKRDFFPSSDPRAQESGDVGYYEVFKNHTKISKVPTYTLSSSHQGATIRVSDGEEAVAFEVRENEANSRLLYFSNSFTFTVPSKVYQSSAKVYAVQADGQRILLTAR